MLYRVIQKALDDCYGMNTPRQWASIEVNHTETVRPVVNIHYGTIHSNGMQERAIGTRSYFLDTHGDVKFVTSTHA